MSSALTDAGPRAARIIDRLDALFEIDRMAGTNRPGLGEGEQRAFDQTREWMEQAGLTVSVDLGGNLYGRLRGPIRPPPRCGPGRISTRRPTAAGSTALSE